MILSFDRPKIGIQRGVGKIYAVVIDGEDMTMTANHPVAFYNETYDHRWEFSEIQSVDGFEGEKIKPCNVKVDDNFQQLINAYKQYKATGYFDCTNHDEEDE